jgi:hypothetical protein
MDLLEDGRLARRWLGSGATALAVRLRAFLNWVYRRPRASVPELITVLGAARYEDGTRKAIRDVIARAFGGEPLPDRTPFTNLSPDQQAALRAVAEVDDYFWCVAGLLSPVLTSYGLPPFERKSLEEYIAGARQ